jgi:hypothetical protein
MTSLGTATTSVTRRHTVAQRRTAAYLVDLAGQVGRPVSDGRVLVPTPMAELSARSGRSRNCGTLYAHIRALRPAVSRPAGESGLLLDVAALHLIVEAGPGPPAYRPCPGEARHAPQATVAFVAGSSSRTAGETSDQQLGAICEVVRDLVGLVHRLIDLAGADAVPSEAVTELRTNVRELEQVLADGPRYTSRTIRDIADPVVSPDQREGGRVSEVIPDQTLPPSLSVVRDVRDTAQDLADGSVADEEPVTSRTDIELLNLVGPLVALSERANLVGLTDIGRLRSALAPYRDDQVLAAVSKTAAMAKAGQVRSPIGWLITKARQGDALFFPTGPSPTTTTPSPSGPPPGVPSDPVDHEAEQAVTAMEDDPVGFSITLEALDRTIRAAGPIGERILADERMRHRARVRHWRLSHPNPAGTEAEANL